MIPACLILFLSIPPLAANPLDGILTGPKVTGAALLESDQPGSLLIRFPSTETPATVELAVPPAARDWSRFAAFTFRFRSTSSIRFSVQVRNGKGETFTYRVQPYPNVAVKASIPMRYFTREFMNNRQFTAYWLSNWANHIDITQVETLTVSMSPNREVTLRLGPLELHSTEVADEAFVDQPLVDEFGLWKQADWPGKPRTLAELRGLWKAEEEALAKTPDFGFCSYGGRREWKAPAKGYFYTKEQDGRWWLVDPDGHLFFSAGPDCVRFQDPTRHRGREKLFPPQAPPPGETIEFYNRNVRLRFGEEHFLERWKAHVARRLRSWGFNTIANWSNPALWTEPQMPFVANVSIGGTDKNWQRFPDVYSEEFARSAAAAAQAQCAPLRQERFLIGYFIGNEPRWHARNLVGRILEDPEPSATQRFARDFLTREADTPASRERLLETLARHYFRAVTEAIRKTDPNHLVLGIRWAGSAPPAILRANDVFDVFSINIYQFEPPREQIEKIYNMVRRPILIGEFHFGAAERGYAPALVMVKDQTERGVAYQYYLERAATLPPIVGAHYFQLCDQPVTGRFDGENYNLGFVDQTDLPYPEMVAFARAAHRRMYDVHSGKLSPVTRKAVVQ